jgi:DNA-directed RNA polymerase specialized sigma24 family protein
MNRDSDPDITIAAVHEAARQRQFVSNLRAYAARTIFRAMRKFEVSEAKRAARADSGYTHKLPALDFQPEQIENRILIRELMETLSPTDREIFSLRMYRCTFPEIDAQLKLRPRTAEQRYRACKDQLAELLRQKQPD